jgi:hypothetical protein
MFRLALDIMLVQRLSVIGIILIIIYSLYRKREGEGNADVWLSGATHPHTWKNQNKFKKYFF